jgi:hypothetical protein
MGPCHCLLALLFAVILAQQSQGKTLDVNKIQGSCYTGTCRPGSSSSSSSNSTAAVMLCHRNAPCTCNNRYLHFTHTTPAACCFAQPPIRNSACICTLSQTSLQSQVTPSHQHSSLSHHYIHSPNSHVLPSLQAWLYCGSSLRRATARIVSELRGPLQAPWTWPQTCLGIAWSHCWSQ